MSRPLEVLTSSCHASPPDSLHASPPDSLHVSPPDSLLRRRQLWLGGISSSDDSSSINACFNTTITPFTATCNHGAWRDGRGYAFLTFDSEGEAVEMMKSFVSTRGLEIRRCIWQDSPDTSTSSSEPALHPPLATTTLPLHECETDGMPSLPDQLSPLSEKQLRLRLTTLGRPSDPSDERAAYSRGGRLAKKAYLLDLLASCYREGLAVRVVRRITAGIALPADRTSAVLEALRHADFGKKGGGKSRNVEVSGGEGGAYSKGGVSEGAWSKGRL